jgi:hypothetical protein
VPSLPTDPLLPLGAGPEFHPGADAGSGRTFEDDRRRRQVFDCESERLEQGDLASRARSRVASAETAAVRIAVTAVPFMRARSSPVSPSKRATAPWWGSICRSALPGKIPIAFRPKAGWLPPR